jgi:hypothetical protein
MLEVMNSIKVLDSYSRCLVTFGCQGEAIGNIGIPEVDADRQRKSSLSSERKSLKN